MRRSMRRFVGVTCSGSVVVLLATTLVVLGVGDRPAPAPGAAERPLVAGADAEPVAATGPAPRVELSEPEVELPRIVGGSPAIRLLGDQLDDAALLNDLTPSTLRQVLRNDDSARLDTRGRMFYADPVVTSTSNGA